MRRFGTHARSDLDACDASTRAATEVQRQHQTNSCLIPAPVFTGRKPDGQVGERRNDQRLAYPPDLTPGPSAGKQRARAVGKFVCAHRGRTCATRAALADRLDRDHGDKGDIHAEVCRSGNEDRGHPANRMHGSLQFPPATLARHRVSRTSLNYQAGERILGANHECRSKSLFWCWLERFDLR